MAWRACEPSVRRTVRESRSTRLRSNPPRARLAVHLVELAEFPLTETKGRCSDVFFQVVEVRGPGNCQHNWRTLQDPRQRDLNGFDRVISAVGVT